MVSDTHGLMHVCSLNNSMWQWCIPWCICILWWKFLISPCRKGCVWSFLQEGPGQASFGWQECFCWCWKVHVVQTQTWWVCCLLSLNLRRILMADMSFSHICLHSSNYNSLLKHKFKLFTYSLNKRSLKYKELLDPLHLSFLLFNSL